jgi:hypothetical protein
MTAMIVTLNGKTGPNILPRDLPESPPLPHPQTEAETKTETEIVDQLPPTPLIEEAQQ